MTGSKPSEDGRHGKMDKSLLSGVIPPVNKRDIEATTTAAKAAA